VFFLCLYCRHNTNKGIEQMTNDTKSSAEDVAQWESIKQNMLDRADVVSGFADGEREALHKLQWASMSISEDVCYLMDFCYSEVVEFCRAADFLCEEYSWNTSENEEKRDIGRNSLALAEALRGDAGGGPRLSFGQAKNFDGIYPCVTSLLNTKPNKYQMERFAEHGITWEGEVNEH
jgi:hypothetical protein